MKVIYGIRVRALLPVAAWLLLAATPAVAAEPYEVVQPATLKPGDPIPPPAHQVVLRVHGATKAKGKGPLELDRETLEKMGLVRYTAPNRWYPTPVTFEGVLIAAFLDVVGAPPQATMMRMRALNDYEILLPIAEARRWPLMFALKLNGSPMRVRDKGPIWVVYPAHLEPMLAGAAYQGKWIWQLAEITFQ